MAMIILEYLRRKIKNPADDGHVNQLKALECRICNIIFKYTKYLCFKSYTYLF